MTTQMVLMEEKDLAELLRVDRESIIRWRHAGLLPPHIKVGQRVLWREDTVYEWLLDNEAGNRGRLRPLRDDGAALNPQELPGLAEAYATGDYTLDELAAHYGVSREWIRLMVQAVDPNAARKARAQRKLNRDVKHQERQTELLLRRMQTALDEDRHCVVCGAWVIRAPRNKGQSQFTCSQECARAWPIIRTAGEFRDDHRRTQAFSILKHPEGQPPSRIDWAKRMLSDNPPPANRTYFVPGSKRSEILRKYRPDLFAEQ